MKQRIVILTPGQLGSNPRVVKEADALHAAGFDVHVIATKVSDFVESRDREVLATVPWTAERIAFDGLAVRRRERAVQEVAQRMRRLAPTRTLDALAQSAFARQLARAACRRSAALTIAHYPAALSAAAAAARTHEGLFAFDAEDFHPGDLPDSPEHSAATDLIRRIEGRHLPGAAYVTAASPGIADAYAKTYAIARPTVVLNVFGLDTAPCEAAVARPALGPSIYWFSQVRGPDRGLECALEAIAQAKSQPHLYLRGTGRQPFDEALRGRADALGVAGRLHLLDPEPPSQMVRLAAQYDLGLVGETGTTHNRRIALTNKQFTYLLAGVPAVMSDVPAHVDFAAEADGAAFLYRTEDPASLAKVLDDLIGDPERLAAARARAFALGRERYNWDREKAVLVETVERALHKGTTR
ncbi:glycosyltransferase [Acuticoccus yangtzensis]|uniref:glycosyltransferase n=1 Tax=Acuticoccus yangtzensis TaxID=1443441 RepID=UPI0009499120|nr:glycosyltransferase [Acuticoccus yangtzensis]